MKNFIKAIDGRTVQEFVHLCNLAESDGITDIRFVRQLLDNKLLEIIQDATKQTPRYGKRKVESRERCPSCGRGYMVPGKYLSEAEWCSAKCGYSRMVK